MPFYDQKDYLVKCFFSFILYFAVIGYGVSENNNNLSADDQALGYAIIHEYPVNKFAGSSTNWFVQQHENGTIFLSNANGFYSFDGATWRKHYIADKAEVRQFVIVGERIYLGAESELGYFEATANGELHYHSLLPQLTSKQRMFSAVNNVYYFEEHLYFVSPEQIMVYSLKNGFKLWQPNKRFSRAWLAKDKLFFTDGNTLNYFENDHRYKVDGFTDKNIHSFGFVEKTASGYLIGTFSQGIYLWKKPKNEKSTLVTWLANNNSLATSGFYNSTRVNTSIIALASIRNGVIFFNNQGKVLYHLTKENGLPVNITTNLFVDKQQGLWLTQEGALVRVELPFTISTFSSKQSNIAKIRAFARAPLSNELFFSAINGIYTLNEQGKVSLYPDVITSTAKITPFKQYLLIAGAQQCQMLNPDNHHIVTVLETAYCKDIYVSKYHQNTIFMINELGILYSQWTGSNWTKAQMLLNDNQINSAIVEDKYGDLWSANNLGELIRFHHAEQKWQVKKYQVSESAIQPMELNGELLIATDEGLFYWGKHRQNKRQQQLADKVSWFHDYFGEQADAPSFIYQDKHQRLWLATSEHTGYFHITDQNQYVQWTTFPITASGMHNLRTVFDEPNQTWLGFDSGIVRYHQALDNVDKVFETQAFISELAFTQGNKTMVLNILKYHTSVLPLEYSEKSLRVYFALTNYLQGQNNQYRYKLNNQPWSQWSRESYVDLGQLSGGDYQLLMQAKDPHAKVYTARKFAFHITPPWYLTSWAYVSYVVVLLCIIYLLAMLFTRIKTKKLLATKQLLEQQVAERTLTIQQQADELVKLGEAKSRFFANVSHEFRTPLTLTITPLQDLLNENRITDPQDRQYIQVAIQNSQQMLSLVGEILDINRLESGEMKLAIRKIELGKTIHAIVQRFKLTAEKQKIQLHEINLTQAGAIWFDYDHLNKIVSNLLSNAIKFSPEHSQIDIGIEFNKAEQMVSLWVKDQGCGIPEDELPYLYDRFHQGVNSSNNFQPGTGIGLSMVKDLLTLHQGSITLEQNNQISQGCLFRIRLKMGNSHYTPEQFVDADVAAVAHNEALPQLVEQAEGVDNEVETSLQPTILVVDDHDDLRNFIRNTLQKLYKVITAKQGQQALAMVQEQQPDFIISDVMMPVMDGFELAQKLKENEHTAHIPLLLLTAKSTKRETVAGLQCGADDYLVKPFDTSELIARIHAHLQQKRHIAASIYKKFLTEYPQVAKPINENEQTPKIHHDFEEKFNCVISNNVGNVDLDINLIADLMNMDRSTLFRKVKKCFSCTPNNYIKMYRLQLSLQMLQRKSGTVSEIAYAVGFKSLNYFSRSFKEHFNVAPSEYQKISV